MIESREAQPGSQSLSAIKLRRQTLLRWLLILFLPPALGFALRQDSLAVAPVSTARVSGDILDIAGAPIQSARIWIYEQSGKANFSTQTNQSGTFTVELPTGYYFVFVGSAGFAPFSQSIWAEPGKQIKLHIRLKPDLKNMQD